MIVCSCNVVSHQEIETTVEKLVLADPEVVLTAGAIYREIGIRPKCGTCLKNVVSLIHGHRQKLINGNMQIQSIE